MDSFWDVSWWDVFVYGVVPPIVLVVPVGTRDLVTAEPHRADLGKCQAAPMG